MSDTPDSLYQALEPEAIIGPEHHRFKLIKQGHDHPLGQFWHAEDQSVTGTPIVTLLMIAPGLLKQKSFVEGLKTHAAQIKTIQNKHVAECYGYFTEKGKLMFLSFEKLDGLTLKSMMEKGSQLTAKQQMTLINQIAYSIDISFQKLRSAHGCLETGAIFVNRKSGIKLTQHGLRETLESASSLLSQPVFYQQYQAPEAFHPAKLDRRADVYSFACILYEMMTGKAPFSVDDTEADRVRRELSQPQGLDDEQWLEMQKAFSTNTEERFASCTDLVKAVFTEDNKDTEEAKDNEQAPAKEMTEGASEETLTEQENTAKKFKLPSFTLPTLSKHFTYTLLGAGIFIGGFLIGWSISSFLNFQVKDFQALQIDKQKQALQQMYSSLQAQQELHAMQEKSIQEKDIRIQLLQNDLDHSLKQASMSDPDNPGNTLFKDQINKSDYGPEMVLLPSGKYRMGDQSGLGDDNERPVHIVSIEKPFSLSRFEITFAEYDLFAKLTNRQLPDDEGWGRENRPVINVSWRDAKAYAEWLADQTEQPYRLPSEAEWEYAARAGNLTTYWWGDQMKPNMAACSDCDSLWDGKQTAPVGSFQANSWGLHDMTGNVDEWVEDCYEDNYNLAPIDGSAYTQRVCSDRVMRGGSWFEISRLIRPASRYRHPTDAKRNSWGFRVALDMK
ncbi:MAG: SUMF1/EgtB/PvdO family nonheme iron enzyme [Neptuniibacter sp.]